MNRCLREDAEKIARGAIRAVCPDEAVRRALEHVELTGDLYLVAAGKAAWQMAAAALAHLDRPIRQGIVVTKYDHVMGELPGIRSFEAGHPVPDENSYRGAQAVLDLTENLKPEDLLIYADLSNITSAGTYKDVPLRYGVLKPGVEGISAVFISPLVIPEITVVDKAGPLSPALRELIKPEEKKAEEKKPEEKKSDGKKPEEKAAKAGPLSSALRELIKPEEKKSEEKKPEEKKK